MCVSVPPHPDGCCDDQRPDYLYVNEQYCSVCAQMVPTWSPAYCQEDANLPSERERDSEENEDRECKEGVCVCVCVHTREREREREHTRACGWLVYMDHDITVVGVLSESLWVCPGHIVYGVRFRVL